MSEAPYQPSDADSDRPASPPAPPRYSASASVPMPPPIPPASERQAPAFGNPASLGQGQQYGQGGAPLGQPPASPPSPPPPPATGAARVAASASVPAPAAPSLPSYGAPPQGFPAQPATYGSPAQAGGPAPSGNQYGSPAPGTYGSAGAGQYGSSYGQSAPPMGTPSAAAGQSPPGFGMPPMGTPNPSGHGGGPGAGGAGGASGAGGVYGPPAYGPPADQSRRPDGWAYAEEQSAPPARKSKRGLIITLIVAAIVVVVGVGGYVGWSLTKNSSQFAVGTCVKQDGEAGVVVDCSTQGAFRIVSIQDSVTQCPDPNQPSLKLTAGLGGGTRYACLAPAA